MNLDYPRAQSFGLNAQSTSTRALKTNAIMTFGTVQIQLARRREDFTSMNTHLAYPRLTRAHPPSARSVSQLRPPSQRRSESSDLQRRPNSQRQPDSASQRRLDSQRRQPHGGSRPLRGPSCIVEEDETTTTPEVMAEIIALRHLVLEAYSFNFYHPNSRVSVCRKIGMTILRDIVQNSYKDGKVL